MSTTSYLNLTLTQASENQMSFLDWRTLMNGEGCNSNMEIIDQAFADGDNRKINKVASPVAGNLASLDANGNVTDSGKKPANFENAGAAAAVQSSLNDHKGNNQNPHSVTASQIGAATASQGSKADSALQGVKVNGTSLTPDANKNVNIDISGKADKVSSPVNGNFAGMDANGNLTNSGKKATDFENAGAANAVQQNLNTHTSDKTNPHDVTPAQIGAATSAQGTKADSAIQVVKVNGTSLVPDGNKAVNIDTSGKVDKVASATAGNFASLNASGSIEDSGKKATSFDNAGAAAAVQQSLNTHTGNTNNPHSVTPAQIGAATSGQGTKADSAIQSIKVNGSAVAPDANKAVNIDISGKADKISSPTNGNFAGMDANGNITNSGKKASDFDSAGAASAVQQNLNSHTGNQSNPHSVTAAQVGAATTAQGAKADSAIQSIKLAGTALSPDSNKSVNIPIVRNDSTYAGADLSTLFANVAAFRAAVNSGDFSKIFIGDYWPVTLTGTYRDYGTYTCPSGTVYYSDTALATEAGTTSSTMDAVYINDTYCEITISSVKYYVGTTNCLAYRERSFNNAVVKLEVAGINHYWKYGDSGSLTGALNHILFCSRDCLPNTMRMRKANAVWEDDTATTPWLGCAAYRTFNDPDYGIINLVAATEFGSYIYAGPNNKGMRALMPLMAPNSSSTTSWSWQDRGKLFLPTEREVWGQPVHQANALHGGLTPQWPVFASGLKKICKGLGNGGSRCNWWCSTATSATTFAAVNGGGLPNGYNASSAFGVPLCFLFS